MINLLLPIVKAMFVDDVSSRIKKATEKAETALQESQLSKESKEKLISEVAHSAKNKPFWLSFKFRACLVGALVPILNHVFKWNLDEQTVNTVFTGLLSAAGFQAAADFGKNK